MADDVQPGKFETGNGIANCRFSYVHNSTHLYAFVIDTNTFSPVMTY